MTVSQFYPLEINPITSEPFLRLQNHPNIIITPPRWSDAKLLGAILNDDRVYPWLERVPHPYSEEDGKEWIEIIKPQCDAIIAQLKEAGDEGEPKIIGHSPVEFLREINQDGTETFIGSISLIRSSSHGELMGTGDTLDWEGSEKNVERNNLLEVGDPGILWSIGYYLAPSHHGKGIMSDAVGTLIHRWAVPRMNVRKMLGIAFIGNNGSKMVFEKNGFTLTHTLENHYEVKGKMQGLYVLEWKLEQ